jgi:hypothetical protein
MTRTPRRKRSTNSVPHLASDGDKQYAAARRLLQELAQLQKPTGIDHVVYTEHECIEITVRHGPWRRVWYGHDLKFKICDDKFDQSKSTRNLDVAIQYDPVGDTLIGTDDDPSIVPVPGGKRIKRDALAVLVDAVATDVLSSR